MVRALVVGTGAIGMRHIRNLTTVVPDVELLVLRRSAALPPELAGRASVVTSLDDAVAWRPDIAVVATPSALHMDVLPGLMQAGIACFVEKPVVTTLDDIDTLQNTLRNAPPRAHATGFNLRLLPSLQAAVSAIKAGRVGRVVRASFAAGQWLPQWRPTRDHRTSYSSSAALGGGAILDLSHELDSARSFLGECAVIACIAKQVPELEIDSEGVASILLQSQTGAAVSVSVDYVARAPIRRYEVVGTEGTIVWDLSRKSLVLQTASGTSDLVTDPAAFDVGQTYIAALNEFLAAALSDGRLEHLPTLEDGLASSGLAIAAKALGAQQ